jgi:hypothetical protein
VVHITLHGWLGKYGDMGRGAGGGLSVGGESEEDAGIDVVEGAEAEGEVDSGDAGDVGDDGDEVAEDAELLVSSSEDDNPSSCTILTF